MLNIKFSICIPAYKSKYLEETIKSVLNQSFKNFELIIINDASPENIDQIVNVFSDNRIKYYKNDKNIGAEHVIHNWNKCLQNAKGEYFVLLGDDDLLLPEYIDEFVHLIDKYPDLNIYHCRTIIIDEKSVFKKLTPLCPEFESVYDSIWHRINNHRIQFISDFVYKTSVLKENGGFYFLPLAWASDDITAYIASGKKGIAYLQKPVFCYRSNTFSISSNGNSQLKMKAIIGEEEWLKSFLKEISSNDYDELLRRDILAALPFYIRKKKIETIARGLSLNFTAELFKWIKIRNEYSIKLLDIMLSIIEFTKIKYLIRK